MTLMRWRKSLNQLESGFNEANEHFLQLGGRALLMNDTYMSSRSEDITTKPFMAFYSSRSDVETRSISLLYFSISCIRTVERDGMYPVSVSCECLA